MRLIDITDKRLQVEPFAETCRRLDLKYEDGIVIPAADGDVRFTPSDSIILTLKVEGEIVDFAVIPRHQFPRKKA